MVVCDIEFTKVESFASLIISVLIISVVFFFQRRKIHNLQERTDLRQALDEEVIQAQMEIRNESFQRIGASLRDNIGQLLSVTKLYIHAIEEMSVDSQVMETVLAISGLMSTTIDEVRYLSRSIDDNFVNYFGIINSITLALNHIQKTKGIATSFNIRGEAFEIDFKKEIILVLVVHEIFNNVIKHAVANNLTVDMRFGDADFNLLISDNGTGFDYALLDNKPIGDSKTGISTMLKRISLIGGTCKIETAVGKGTSVKVRITK